MYIQVFALIRSSPSIFQKVITGLIIRASIVRNCTRMNACSVISVMWFIFNLYMTGYILLHEKHVLLSSAYDFCSIQYKLTLLLGMVACCGKLLSLLAPSSESTPYLRPFTLPPLITSPFFLSSRQYIHAI
jgi:hypothetical protein